MKALLAGILACGFFSIPSLDIRGYPELPSTRIMVEVEVPGLSTAYLSASVLKLTTEALTGIEGLHKLYYGVLDGRVIFQLAVNPNESDLSEIRRMLQGLRPSFPHQAGPPRIFALPRQDSSAVFFFAQKKSPVEVAAKQMRELREELLELPAVRSVLLRGVPDREIEVRLDPSRLAAAGLSPLTVEEAMHRSLFKMNAGIMASSSRRSDLILDSGINSVEDLREIPVPLTGEKNDKYTSLGEISEITWSPPLYRERIRLKEQQPGGLLHIHFEPGTGLFERFRTLHSAARILSSRSWVLDRRLIENSLSGSIGPLFFLLFGTLSTTVLLSRIRPFLQIYAPPALLITFYAMTGKILYPDALIGMGTAALLSAALPLPALPPSVPTGFSRGPLPGVLPSRVLPPWALPPWVLPPWALLTRASRRLSLFMATAVLLPVGIATGLPSQAFLQILCTQLLAAILLEGIYRYNDAGSKTSAVHPGPSDSPSSISLYLPSLLRFRFAVIFGLVIFTATASLNREYFPGLRLYAVLPSVSRDSADSPDLSDLSKSPDLPAKSSLNIPEDSRPPSKEVRALASAACSKPVFTMDYPQEPPDAFSFQTEHWLTGLDRNFFIIAVESAGNAESTDRPEDCFPGVMILPFSGFGKNEDLEIPMGMLFEGLTDRTRTPDSRRSSLHRKSVVFHDEYLRLEPAPEKLADSKLSRPVVLHHLEMALKGIEVGQIEGPQDDRAHTVRLLYGKYGYPDSLLKLPIFPGDTLPPTLGDISSLRSERKERVVVGEVFLK